MATAAEKKALVFFTVMALLGAGVRLWRTHSPQRSRPDAMSRATDASADASDDVSASLSPRGKSPPPRSTRRHSTNHLSNGRSKKESIRDSVSIIDLDRATQAQIEALGVLKPGVARLIVADRDTFGPFGSIQEL